MPGPSSGRKLKLSKITLLNSKIKITLCVTNSLTAATEEAFPTEYMLILSLLTNEHWHSQNFSRGLNLKLISIWLTIPRTSIVRSRKPGVTTCPSTPLPLPLLVLGHTMVSIVRISLSSLSRGVLQLLS